MDQVQTVSYDSEEVSSIEWEFIHMTEEEEDLIYRMYKLVGNRWALIAGRIPGRKAEEIERFWIMVHLARGGMLVRELKKLDADWVPLTPPPHASPQLGTSRASDVPP